MAAIKKIDEGILYENPIPLLRSRQAKFPGLALLPSGELIALFEMGEAFDSADCKTYVTRSLDAGKTWQFQGDLYDPSLLPAGLNISECLKPTLLDDGTLVAIGYRYHRPDPETPIGNPETGGLLPGDNIISFSNDDGKTWSIPEVIDRGCPELVETSGPCIQTQSGDLIAIGCPFKSWDGSNPTGQTGVLLRSKDKGKTWDTSGRFFETPRNSLSPWETRICEMKPGRLVTIAWTFNISENKHLANHVTVSHDDGHSWSEPIDTGHMAQASNLMSLGEDLLMTIHAHRTSDVGLVVRLVDFKNDRWRVKEESVIWGAAKAQDTSKGFIDQFGDLKFGQPSLLRLNSGEILATHWCVEDGLHKIKTHRLALTL
jgi:sialidase-1